MDFYRWNECIPIVIYSIQSQEQSKKEREKEKCQQKLLKALVVIYRLENAD